MYLVIFADDKRLTSGQGEDLLRRYRNERKVWLEHTPGGAKLVEKDKLNILGKKKLNTEVLQFVAEVLLEKHSQLGGLNDPGTLLDRQSNKGNKVNHLDVSDPKFTLQFHLVNGNHWVLTPFDPAGDEGCVLLWDPLSPKRVCAEIQNQVYKMYKSCRLQLM